MKKLKNLDDKKILKILFVFSMIYLVILGIMLVYNYDITNTYDLLFEADSTRIIGDMTNLYANHYRLKVHPLFVILTEPIFFILKGFTMNNMLALIVLSSLVSSLTIVYIYKILSLYSDNKKIKILVSLCYLFSFSNLIFTSGIEIYNFAALFLVILWYYVLKIVKEKELNNYTIIILSILGVLSISFTITNVAIFLIILFILLVFKKIKFIDLLITGMWTISIFLIALCLQNFIWHNTPTISSNNFTEEQMYTNYNIKFDNVKNVITGDFSNSILSNNIYAKSINNSNEKYILNFEKTNSLNIIVITIFYILLIILIIKNYKTNSFVNIGLILSVLFNTALHTVYGNGNTFLYSLHFVYLFFIGFGINLLTEKNELIKKICYAFLVLLLVLEILINNYIFIKVVDTISRILNANFYVKTFGLLKSVVLSIIVILLISFFIYLIIKLIKKIKTIKDNDKKIVNIIYIILLILGIQLIFITIETSTRYEMILWKKIIMKEKIKLDIDNIRYKNIVDNYSKEINELKQYANEYNDFLNSYNCETEDLFYTSNYFFFGLGNRKKLLFKDNSIIDILTNETIYSFNVKSSVIIPNLYMVIIETTNNNYIKIKEDNNGVHIIRNNEDKIIEGTNYYIELFEFKNQKYQNIKKVLYNEILFNIKDSIIYPNILVYDKPWYRDAAMVSMVLKQTNNTDLISNWVSNINEIYDKQNKGNEETDNLGELLYIISTQKNINDKLMNKIEKEALNIASKNPNGYYLSGSTDYSNRPMYQSLWYKFGIESLGKKYIFNLPEKEDDYTPLTWWSKMTENNSTEIYANISYPYLSYGAYHTTKKGSIPVSNKLYPLSWEKSASEANYKNMNVLDEFYSANSISPLHSWTASELLLMLLDDTNDLKEL